MKWFIFLVDIDTLGHSLHTNQQLMLWLRSRKVIIGVHPSHDVSAQEVWTPLQGEEGNEMGQTRDPKCLPLIDIWYLWSYIDFPAVQTVLKHEKQS